jgi:Hypervirulence associated proteins TUDOR domain
VANQLKTGVKVAWQSSGGGSVGRVERKLTSPGKIKGHEVGASEDNAGGTGRPSGVGRTSPSSRPRTRRCPRAGG